MIQDEVRNVIKAAGAVTGPSDVGMITEHGGPTPLILKLEDRFPAIERGLEGGPASMHFCNAMAGCRHRPPSKESRAVPMLDSGMPAGRILLRPSYRLNRPWIRSRSKSEAAQQTVF